PKEGHNQSAGDDKDPDQPIHRKPQSHCPTANHRRLLTSFLKGDRGRRASNNPRGSDSSYRICSEIDQPDFFAASCSDFFSSSGIRIPTTVSALGFLSFIPANLAGCRSPASSPRRCSDE